MTNAWNGPEGLQARKVLEDAVLLIYIDRGDSMTIMQSFYGIWFEEDVPYSDERESRISDHAAHCIHRDAARRFLEKTHPRGLCFEQNLDGDYIISVQVLGNGWQILTDPLPYDTALIAAVIAVGKEKTNG